MCLSRFGQVAYGALALVAVGLILVSIFTPGWRRLSTLTNSTNSSSVSIQTLNNTKKQLDMGLFSFTCGQLTNGSTISQQNVNTPTATNNSLTGADICKQWWVNLSTSDQIVIATMILSLVAAVVAFVWNVLTFFACCCKGTIHKPLPALAGITAALLTVALVVFYTKNQDNIEHFVSVEQLKDTLSSQGNISYSFYVACGALACSIANVVIGTLIVCLADKCL